MPKKEITDNVVIFSAKSALLLLKNVCKVCGIKGSDLLLNAFLVFGRISMTFNK